MKTRCHTRPNSVFQAYSSFGREKLAVQTSPEEQRARATLCADFFYFFHMEPDENNNVEGFF